MRGKITAGRFGITILAILFLSQVRAVALSKLDKAAMKGNTKKVEDLLAKGKKVDARTAQGDTALFYAVAYNRLETARVLLKNGADPNAADNQKYTPLLLACSVGIMKALIAKGAKVDARSITGQTPIEHASLCKTGVDKLLQILLQAGADPNTKDKIGMTPLHIAMGYSDVEAARVLLQNGAKVNAENVQRLTPRDIAAMLGKQDLVSLLDAHGGKSLKYTQKHAGEVEVFKGHDYPRQILSGSEVFLKHRFEEDPGFCNIAYKILWNSGMVNRLGFTYRPMLMLSGRFFAEPGHVYLINTYAGPGPTRPHGVVIDKADMKQVGVLY